MSVEPSLERSHEQSKEKASSTTETSFNVLIVGAGISGIGAAFHLQDQTPGTSFLILETLDSFGGTWLTHTYPGIRSDSDLYTFGYCFKPWIGAPIASAKEILNYMSEVIGSGATAATLVPAIAAECEPVTVLQYSPTYFIPCRNENELADQLRRLEIDKTWIHEII